MVGLGEVISSHRDPSLWMISDRLFSANPSTDAFFLIIKRSAGPANVCEPKVTLAGWRWDLYLKVPLKAKKGP